MPISDIMIFSPQDSLLASIAENETQTELAARVSSWKQRTEHDLEEEVIPSNQISV